MLGRSGIDETGTFESHAKRDSTKDEAQDPIFNSTHGVDLHVTSSHTVRSFDLDSYVRYFVLPLLGFAATLPELSPRGPSVCSLRYQASNSTVGIHLRRS